jgi:hypothetical protein
MDAIITSHSENIAEEGSVLHLAQDNICLIATGKPRRCLFSQET